MYSTEGTSASYRQDVQFYRGWLQMGENDAPTFADNMKWMLSWQMWQMYGRYFMWNFAGRTNQMDGQQQMGGFSGYVDGDWTTGLIDGGKQLPKSLIHKDAHTPIYSTNSYTPLYALPLILGLIGMLYHFSRKKRDALIVVLLWFFTGLAIVLYVNQPSVQPRERDYSYVGSFYAFAIWIGLGAIALGEFAQKWINAKTAALGATIVCLLLPLLVASKEWGAHDRSTKMTAHDMAYNYLISCPPNAILFTYGDNDTYSLWYDQEVEGIRPDVRIVNLSLFSGDWYIRQMTKKMNASEPLPITMAYDKYKEGVRDGIQFYDKNIPGASDLKEVFDFITSDNEAAKVELQNGDKVNYLPTKSFKLAVNANEVLKNGIITPDQKSKLADTITWKTSSNYVTKDNLAFMDILAHNNWKRPICFTTTVGQENMMGLQKYLYKEGFTYRLIPFKVDTTIKDQLTKTNTMVMYDNVMNKFKWGKFKTAKYLDPESSNMFYPVLLTTVLDLTQNLIQEGHRDLALKVLHKYDAEMPEIYPFIDLARQKYFLSASAYSLNDIDYANKYANSVDAYLVEQLDYNYNQLQKGSTNVDGRVVQLGLSVMNALAQLAVENHQTAIATKFQKQLKDYENKFAPILGRQ